MKPKKKVTATTGMFTLLKSPELIHPTIFPKIKEEKYRGHTTLNCQEHNSPIG